MHVAWEAWLKSYKEEYLPLYRRAVAHVARNGYAGKLAAGQALPALLAAETDRFFWLVRPSAAAASWSVEEAAVARMYDTHPRQMQLYQIMAGMDLILDTYDARHNRADMRTYVARLPLHAALFAAYGRQFCVRWVLLGMQRIQYWHTHRPDILRALSKAAQSADEVFVETRNANIGGRQDPRTPIEQVLRTLQRNTALADAERETSARLDVGRSRTEVTLERAVTRNAHKKSGPQRAAVPRVRAYLKALFTDVGMDLISLGEAGDPFAAGLVALADTDKWVGKTQAWLAEHVKTRVAIDAAALERAKAVSARRTAAAMAQAAALAAQRGGHPDALPASALVAPAEQLQAALDEL